MLKNRGNGQCIQYITFYVGYTHTHTHTHKTDKLDLTFFNGI